ncbi:MAG: SDR family NAD(P)-dependent oxidoreductase [Pseudomonadota bacterium]|jgi:NADP-dependent 3-hydroxy acid dehydrogenase YdfG|nr:short-chain dehydrogenase [Alphaproteobacteria bacterium]
MKDVKGKVAFITGAASGMGLGMARAFSEAGMKVMLSDIEEGPLQAQVADLKAKGRDVAGVRVDVTKKEDLDAAAKKTIETFGKAHVLCNNAGVGVGGKSETCDLRNWRWCIDVNLWGVVYGLQAFMPLIRSHGEEGHVMSTASMAGMYGVRNLGPYNAAKYAVVAIMETMMAENKNTNIGVSVLCPGAVATNIGSSTRNRQQEYGGSAVPSDLDITNDALAQGLHPDVVGKQVLEAILKNQPYIFTDPKMRKMVDSRFRKIMSGYDWADTCDSLRGAQQGSLQRK